MLSRYLGQIESIIDIPSDQVLALHTPKNTISFGQYKHLLSISAQLNKKANPVQSTPFYD